MKGIFRVAASLVAAALAGPAMASCFSVYDSAQKLVYRDINTPVDLQHPISDTIPARFGGGATMIIAQNGDEDCIAVGLPDSVKAERLAAFSAPEQSADFPPGSWPSTGGSAALPAYWSGRSIGPRYVGPRGGVFHYSGSGRKVYEPRTGGRRR
jgi:hypothetical protein